MGTESVLTALQANIESQEVGNLLAAHLHKPEKAPLFQAALAKFVSNGSLRFASTWSWWAFFGSSFYFFYRKMYLYGLIALGFDIGIAFVLDHANPGVAIFSGLCAKYLYCTKFVKDLEASGYPNKPIDEVNHTLGQRGGYNTWAIVAAVFALLLQITMLFFADKIINAYAGLG
jgi:hypothetical protein